MSDLVITVDRLSKSYWLKHQLQAGGKKGHQYERFSEVLARALSAPFRRRKADEAAASQEEFWALKDVSFEVQRGEVLGIIGRNGAGKSTLLKILSRITDPTSGRVEIDGRVASLLEVGTGFHPELTGRENVFLNGAILGMSRVEIKRKFDEIVAFAEVEKFLDTPVKRYSSGMYVRLAFAVAAHLEPEILIVDEVLAVGDAQFQKKCLGKMQDVSSQDGRTVLFVSHNMEAMQNLCKRAVLLEQGTVSAIDKVERIVLQYMHTSGTKFQWQVANAPAAAHIRSVILEEEALSNGALKVKISIARKADRRELTPGLALFTATGLPVFATNPEMHPPPAGELPLLWEECCLTIDPLPLWNGDYVCSIWLTEKDTTVVHLEKIMGFKFLANKFQERLPPISTMGAMRVNANWQLSTEGG
jgi:lipopolysaccharide transport system ATP-binding protein